MDDSNPRAVIGSNAAPLETAEELARRLELEYAPLISEAAQLELRRYGLPDQIATEEDVLMASEIVLNVKELAKRAEAARTDTGRPYLEAQRTVNGWFKNLSDPLSGMVQDIEKSVGSYLRAKAECERAERLEAERIQREAAEAQRREEERQRQEAERLQREADEAAARIRQAKDAETRAKAAEEMRVAEAAATIARADAEKAGEQAAKAERKADTHERRAAADVGKLSRVASGSSTTSVTEKWAHAITDAGKLMASLGPLGVHLSNDAVIMAIGRLMKHAEDAGTIEHLTLPGVRFFIEHRTNIRATRT